MGVALHTGPIEGFWGRKQQSLGMLKTAGRPSLWASWDRRQLLTPLARALGAGVGTKGWPAGKGVGLSSLLSGFIHAVVLSGSQQLPPPGS